jgi:hypothetical protein
MKAHIEKSGEIKKQRAANGFSKPTGKGISSGQLADNRPEAIQMRAIQKIINNGPLVKEKLLTQRVKLSAAQAAAEADAKRTANKNNRAAMTDNWIATADEGDTDLAWRGLAPGGYTYNTSASITNGGPDRPNSIDLKAKPTLATTAEFIFHLPSFANIQALITYLMRVSRIDAKIREINQISAITLATSTDPELQRIERAERVDISPLTNHPIYIANSDGILAHDPNFLTNLQTNQIDASNTRLDNIRTQPDYVNRLTNMKARAAETKYNALLTTITPLLPDNRSASDITTFGGVRLYMGMLNREYAIAQPLFNDTRKLAHAALNEKFSYYTEVRNAFDLLQQDLTAAVAVAQNATYTLGSWREARTQHPALGMRYLDISQKLVADERGAIIALLRDLKTLLNAKNPNPDQTAGKRKGDEDKKDDNDPAKVAKVS